MCHAVYVQCTQVVDTPARNRLIVDTYKKQALGRKAVAFCCDVKHAQNLTAAFNEGGVKAACLTGRNKASDRAAIIARHKAGEFDVLVSQ
jgi:superfamily II DNA or RNA helicase